MRHRPGFVAPPVAARKFAALDQITGGGAGIHVVSGGNEAEQHRDGDWLDKEGRIIAWTNMSDCQADLDRDGAVLP